MCARKMTHPRPFLKFMSHVFYVQQTGGKTHAFNKSPTNHILPLVPVDTKLKLRTAKFLFIGI